MYEIAVLACKICDIQYTSWSDSTTVKELHKPTYFFRTMSTLKHPVIHHARLTSLANLNFGQHATQPLFPERLRPPAGATRSTKHKSHTQSTKLGAPPPMVTLWGTTCAGMLFSRFAWALNHAWAVHFSEEQYNFALLGCRGQPLELA